MLIAAIYFFKKSQTFTDLESSVFNFFLEFPNSVFGVIGFHHFMDMLKTRYHGVHFMFRLPKELEAHPSVEALLSG
jgi:ABC-type phosphate transport system permease subunit